MIDSQGFRPNVGIILCNKDRQVFWGRRVGQNAWQFPQGGIKSNESPLEAMYRELEEEVGLRPEHVEVLGCTSRWLRYHLPPRFIRKNCNPVCIGQKQIWFLLRLVARDCDVCLRATDHPEFDAWRWSDYWVPLDTVIEFKREVYQQALTELSRVLFRNGRRPPSRRGAKPAAAETVVAGTAPCGE